MNAVTCVYDTIVQYHMTDPGDRIVVGVSGGADSICLLHILKQLEHRLQVELRAVHVHHGLRETAERDAEYTRACCERWGIPLHVFYVDAAKEAEKRGRSVEETGRDLRYASMQQECADWEQEDRIGGCLPEGGTPGYRIAVAHHREDCAETVLFHLCRGSSLAGLTGIRGCRGTIIRPLIRCSRQEIEEYLQGRDISWCTDETNAEYTYTRNYLRGEILPRLQGHVNRQATEHICRTAQDVQEAEDFLQEETQRALTGCRLDGRGYSRRKIRTLHPYMRRRVLYAVLLEAAGGARDLTGRHVEELEGLLEGSGTGFLDLPGNLRAAAVYDLLRIESTTGGDGINAKLLPLSPKDYEMRCFPFCGDLSQIPRGAYTKWLDYDKIGRFPTLRTRQQGDRIAISEGKHKKLTRVMIDQKIPALLRDRVVLPAKGQDILWMPGGQIHADYRVEAATRNILELVLRKDREV